ncbi:MAG: aldo/keto reductase [Methanomassiliicoccus sp.]|nr:aldo/keto reductase [Methanomassiliicoccus sp.]
MAELSFSSTIPLNNGVEMPALGLGVFKVTNKEAYNVVSQALEVGYRHIDTAAYYQNEAGVGRAIRDSKLPREEVFVTTKLWHTDNGYKEALAACDRSLKALGMDYVDLYLVHWPKGDREEAWRAMERLLDEGKARAIGVSNYLSRHLDGTIARSSTVPAVDQVEFSPFLYQEELLSYCRSKGIVLEAYSPLTRGKRLDDPRLVALAREYGRTPAQMLIRWVLQKDMVVIPKSAKVERMRENAAVFDFEISAEDEARMDSFNEDYHTTWNPADIP